MRRFLILATMLVFLPQTFASAAPFESSGSCTSNQFEWLDQCHAQTDESKCNGRCFWAPIGFAHCVGQAEQVECREYDEATCKESENMSPGCRWIVEAALE